MTKNENLSLQATPKQAIVAYASGFTYAAFAYTQGDQGSLTMAGIGLFTILIISIVLTFTDEVKKAW